MWSAGRPSNRSRPLAEQHRHELDLQNVEHPSLQALLGRVGAVQQDIPIARGSLGLCHARLDAPGHKMHPLVAIVRRSGMGRDEDRHTAVMITAQ
jgi:hypothetical protein